MVEDRSILDATSEVYDANVATPGATGEVLNLTACITVALWQNSDHTVATSDGFDRSLTTQESF